MNYYLKHKISLSRKLCHIPLLKSLCIKNRTKTILENELKLNQLKDQWLEQCILKTGRALVTYYIQIYDSLLQNDK